MSSRLLARALPVASTSTAVVPRASSSIARARLSPRTPQSVFGTSVRWNSAVAEKARQIKALPDFSLANKVSVLSLFIATCFSSNTSFQGLSRDRRCSWPRSRILQSIRSVRMHIPRHRRSQRGGGYSGRRGAHQTGLRCGFIPDRPLTSPEMLIR
jgi:hypothetical protein